MRVQALLLGVATASCWRAPLQHTAVSTRRNALGAGLGFASALGAGLGGPLPASAKAKRADEYAPVQTASQKVASGYVRKKTSTEVKKEMLAAVFEPYEAAYNKKDWATLGSLYTPNAKIVDGSSKGPLAKIAGSDFASYVASLPAYADVRLLPTSLVPEQEYDGSAVKTIHAQYDFIHSDGRFRCYRRIVMTPDGWKSDQALFPLDNAKAYSKLTPKRDVFGHLYMQLDESF